MMVLDVELMLSTQNPSLPGLWTEFVAGYLFGGLIEAVYLVFTLCVYVIRIKSVLCYAREVVWISVELFVFAVVGFR
jgi:uncharacterized protein (DUF2062 family)